MRMAQEFFPNLELHASTQMNVESSNAVRLLQGCGVKRMVLARELGLEEIKKLKVKLVPSLKSLFTVPCV